MVSKVTNSIYRGQADSEKNKTNKQQKKVGQSGFKTIGNRNFLIKLICESSPRVFKENSFERLS